MGRFPFSARPPRQPVIGPRHVDRAARELGSCITLEAVQRLVSEDLKRHWPRELSYRGVVLNFSCMHACVSANPNDPASPLIQ